MVGPSDTLNPVNLIQLLSGFSAIPQLVDRIGELEGKIAELGNKVDGINQPQETKLLEGYVSAGEYAARKFFSVKETAFLLKMSEKTVRRLIDRNVLKSSKGIRLKRIPKESIEAYEKATA